MADLPPVVAVVDDNLMFISRVELQLREHGFAAKVFSLAPPTAADLQRLAPAAVLVNVASRAWAPLELIRMLKAELPAAPVIAYAGHKETDLHTAAREAGADVTAANSMISGNLGAALRDAGVPMSE